MIPPSSIPSHPGDVETKGFVIMLLYLVLRSFLCFELSLFFALNLLDALLVLPVELEVAKGLELFDASILIVRAQEDDVRESTQTGCRPEGR